MLNISPLFHTEAGESSLLQNLNLKSVQENFISTAKTVIRECLRSGIPVELKKAGYLGKVPEPRFFTQGSWAYKTLNAPAHLPQQADIDDGAYMPLSFVSQTKRPSTASSIFFTAAEAALRPLVIEKGWKLATDKPTCVRVVISDFAHVDIPLYAIPDLEFVLLEKRALDHGFGELRKAVLAKAEQDAWWALPTDSVLLAHRKDDWIKSDPRPLKQWFEREVNLKGEQLRRIIRFIKAYRDWIWKSGGPSSILLMAVAAPHFEKRDRRDDIALLDVVSKIPDALRKGVCNPIDQKESLTDRLGSAKVEEAAKFFEQLECNLRGAINASDPSQACVWLINQFGNRFPNEPLRVKQVTVAATIAAAPAQRGPSEIVGRTKAG